MNAYGPRNVLLLLNSGVENSKHIVFHLERRLPKALLSWTRRSPVTTANRQAGRLDAGGSKRILEYGVDHLAILEGA